MVAASKNASCNMTTNIPPASPDDLRAWFNENQGKPRIIALMSPTCGFCLIGHQAIRTYNSWLGDAEFVTKRVWVPMMAPDNLEHAQEQASTTEDARITDMYDGHHAVGRMFRDLLGLNAVAWDTYMIYPAGPTWDDELPPMPLDVQYQLWPSYGGDPSRAFVPSTFWWTVVEAVGQSQAQWEEPVPALLRWLNDDHEARVGLEIPSQYR